MLITNGLILQPLDEQGWGMVKLNCSLQLELELGILRHDRISPPAFCNG